MRKANVFAITPRKRHDYPNTGKSHINAENILERQFYPKTINTHWVGDITYIRTHQDWSYLACLPDLTSKEIVGWAMSKHPNAALAKGALRHTIRRQQPDTNQLLFHSEQGVQYSVN